MGRKGSWFRAVKKAFSPKSKEKKKQGAHKSKNRFGCGKCTSFDLDPSDCTEEFSPPHPIPEEIKLANDENEQSKHAYSVALASAVAAEAAVVAAKAAAEVVRLTSSTTFSDKSREEVAAIKIQTAFRGFMARRTLRALRGLVRLKSLSNSSAAKRQAAATLRCMQTLARVQSQIRSRRLRMSEENQALQRQLQLKHERELEKMRIAEEWDASIRSKEQMEANLQNRQEAAIRRERALAYAFSHQWKNPSRSANPMFLDPNNAQWGWSWLERWMSARPWESRSTADKELSSDRASMKSIGRSGMSGEITKAYARRDSIQRSSRPPSRHSPSTPPSKAPSLTGKVRSASPRCSLGPADDDSRSTMSTRSERRRRHSIAGSLMRDDESSTSSPAVPSYMISTESIRAKSRFQSPSGEKTDTGSERGSVSSVKKRLSFPAAGGISSPVNARRHSGPPKVA